METYSKCSPEQDTNDFPQMDVRKMIDDFYFNIYMGLIRQCEKKIETIKNCPFYNIVHVKQERDRDIKRYEKLLSYLHKRQINC